MSDFSVSLALVDFIQPILYSSFIIIMIKNLKGKIKMSLFVPFTVGGIMSICAGLIIPTFKLMVGLGFMEFKLPDVLLTIVEAGVLISSISLFATTFKKNYSEKMYAAGFPISLNTFAIILGAIGMLIMSISLIKIGYRKKSKLAVIFAIMPIVCTLVLGFTSSVVDLYSAASHWVLEAISIIMEGSLLASAITIFKNKENMFVERG